MRYICFFILVLTSWNSWGANFSCLGGREAYEQLKQDVYYIRMDTHLSKPTLESSFYLSLSGNQEYEPLTEQEMQDIQSYSDSYKASIHLSLFYCQMAYGENPENAVWTLIRSVDLGEILSNFILAEYYSTGGWGRHTAAQSNDYALWELESTLQKIRAVKEGYPKTGNTAANEIVHAIYPRTVSLLMKHYTEKYLNEGYGFYDNFSLANYNPMKTRHRHEVYGQVLRRLRYHIKNCLADREGENIMFRTERFSDYIEGFKGKLDRYREFYKVTKEGYCPLYRNLLDEMLIWEANMQTLAMDCVLFPELVSDKYPFCTDTIDIRIANTIDVEAIEKETARFTNFFNQNWQPEHIEITRRSTEIIPAG